VEFSYRGYGRNSPEFKEEISNGLHSCRGLLENQAAVSDGCSTLFKKMVFQSLRNGNLIGVAVVIFWSRIQESVY
jgi:hypothetical protein